MSNVHMHSPIMFLEGSSSAVYFSKASNDAGSPVESKGTAVPIKRLQTNLEVAPWGEDNRFPQNIEQQLAYCGIAKSALDWKAKALYGGGIIPGKITGYEDEGKKEVFEPLDPKKFKEVYAFLRQRRHFRFWMEFLQDWTWYFNCFPEMLLSKDGKKITGFVHQESCDCRYKQMNEKGEIDTVYLSKLWGMSTDQFVKFDPKKTVKGIIANPQLPVEVDGVYVKQLDCIDQYNAVESLRAIAEKQKDKDFKSAIFPVNYPSVNKTYYQLPYWDGARLAGWFEIASKIPSLIKVLYSKAFKIKYHIEVPDTYFNKKFGEAQWSAMKVEDQRMARIELGKDMDKYLSGDENAFKSFISFYDVDPHEKNEYGRIKITPIEDKNPVDKDLITTSAADLQILAAMQVHPTLFGAGTIGTGAQRTGGSDQREAFLIYTSLLKLERDIFLEPIYLVRDYNGWDEDIEFRIRDTQLTTLDKGKGTEKVVS